VSVSREQNLILYRPSLPRHYLVSLVLWRYPTPVSLFDFLRLLRCWSYSCCFVSGPVRHRLTPGERYGSPELLRIHCASCLALWPRGSDYAQALNAWPCCFPLIRQRQPSQFPWFRGSITFKPSAWLSTLKSYPLPCRFHDLLPATCLCLTGRGFHPLIYVTLLGRSGFSRIR